MNPLVILAAISAASTLIEHGVKYMEERRRARELTPAEEAEWDAFVAAQTSKPHWRIAAPKS